MRLQKYIAKCGVTSRRKAESLILAGRISINGHIIKELGTKVNLKSDIVKLDGRIIELEHKKVYIALNKPLGYVTTVEDEFDRPVVLDLTKDIKERIYPVGRLDLDTTGLIILTNDGEFTNILSHPSYEIKKTYLAQVKGRPSNLSLNQMRNGLEIEDYVTHPADVRLINSNNSTSLLEIRIHEGKNRQVRKMCSTIGHPVIALKRIQIHNIELGKLGEGKWRYLNEKEIEDIKKIRD